MTRWISPSLLLALTIGVCMWTYLLVSPPSVSVPVAIEAQWDSIWLANRPAPCSVNSPAWCSGDNKEFLGCVKVARRLGYWEVIKWAPATQMKRLALAVTGNCTAEYNAMWHLHPALIDSTGLHLLFFRDLSGEDLTTLRVTDARVSLMTWAPDQIVAAVKWRGKLVYPVPVRLQ